MKMKTKKFKVPLKRKVKLKQFDTAYTGIFKHKKDALTKLEKDSEKMFDLQDVLYAYDKYALLIIIQAMDAAGKDGIIKHVMSGVNPQGCRVVSFKSPSAEELDHDYLWRCAKELPRRGDIGIFNRSYYEEVLITRVHPEIIKAQKLPPELKKKSIWKERYEDINNFEKYLLRNGIVVLKFFLHISKKEQKKRFLARIDTPDKNWKFSHADAKERGKWNTYMEAYEDMLNQTSTKWAPWYVIPADHKWYSRVAVADIIVRKLKSLNLSYPSVSREHKKELLKAKVMLEKE